MKGRGIVEGEAEGELLVSSQPITFTGGVDTETWKVIEEGHELEGKNVKNKILIFPRGKGTSYNPFAIYAMKKKGTAPKAFINSEISDIILTGCIIAEIPYMICKDAIDLEGGKRARVDAVKGEIEEL